MYSFATKKKRKKETDTREQNTAKILDLSKMKIAALSIICCD